MSGEEEHDTAYRIFPRTIIPDTPIGVQNKHLTLQDVIVTAPVQNWVFHSLGDHKFRIKINGHYTGVQDDTVIASPNPDDDQIWEVSYRAYQDAYTITLASDPTRAWSTPTAFQKTYKIKLAPFMHTPTGVHPPQYVPHQLFQFKRDD